MSSGSRFGPFQMPSIRQRLFPETVRWVLAPLVLWGSGFVTANFAISGRYSWPETSRILILTATVLILSYEFVYKEQLSMNVPSGRAKAAVFHSCVIPYVAGWAVMLALWKL